MVTGQKVYDLFFYAHCIPNHCEYFRKRGQSHKMEGGGGVQGAKEGVQGGGVESPKFMRGNDRVVLSKTHSTLFFLEAFVLCAYRLRPESGVVTNSGNLKVRFAWFIFAQFSLPNSILMNTKHVLAFFPLLSLTSYFRKISLSWTFFIFHVDLST